MVELPTNLAKAECNKLHSIYINKSSLDAVRLAAGSTIQLTNDIIQGKIQNGLCVVRPPGHHAMKTEPCGFCLCNNVAIAAKHAILTSQMTNQDGNEDQSLGPDLLNRNESSQSLVRRVLIVDFDIHHGQGTQYAFYDDPNILYFSIHRYENGLFWPNLRETDFDSVGEGKGIGYNANLPLNSIGMSDIDYITILHQILLPLAHEFQPDLVLVSAGYDAAIGDPEGEMRLSPAAYGHIIHALMSFAKGKVGVVLEGGYFLESLADGVAMSLRALLGDFNMSLTLPIAPPQDTLVTSVLNLKCALKPFWNNLRIHDEYEDKDNGVYNQKGQNLHISSIVYKGERLKYPLNYDHDVYEPGDHYFKHTVEKENALEQEYSNIRQQYDSVIERHRFIKPKRLALAYDANMMFHRNVDDNNHPEKPERIEQIFKTHQDYGLLSRVDEVMHVQSKKATKEDICLVHDEAHWTNMSEIPDLLQGELDNYAGSLESIYLNPNSFDCALLAAGNVIQVVDAVLNEEAEKGVAIVRPPGHHAESDEACGFCIFNNAAVAAKYACQSHDLKRVLIVDWDVHHGNGIQNIFYTSSNVLYISLHRYDNGTFFPGRPDANVDFVGSGQGKGFNVNIPWNGSGMGDTEYALAFYNVVLPIAYEYNPELVLVSAGFDAARGDPLGGCKVSPEMYAHMTHHLSALANGKIILMLEGGYNLNSISLSMTLCTKTLLGDPLPPLAPYKIPLARALTTIRNVIRSYSAYWSCIKGFDCLLPKHMKTDILDELKQSFQLEHDCSNVTDEVKVTRERDSLVENIPKPENQNADIDIYDEFVKDTEYIPSEYGPAVTIPGTNTISEHPFYAKDTAMTQTLTDSGDYGTSIKSFLTENIQETSMSRSIPYTPSFLANQFESLTLTTSQKQVLSMTELSSTTECSNADLNSGNKSTQLQDEYIPFQYGSYPGSGSVYTLQSPVHQDIHYLKLLTQRIRNQIVNRTQ